MFRSRKMPKEPRSSLGCLRSFGCSVGALARGACVGAYDYGEILQVRLQPQSRTKVALRLVPIVVGMLTLPIVHFRSAH
jgi:hypothetical protein